MNNKKLLSKVSAILGIGVFLFLIYKLYKIWNDVESQVSISSYPKLIISLFLMSIFFVMLPFGWSTIIKKTNKNFKLSELILIYAKSQLARYLPGGIWNYVGRTAILKQKGINYGTILQSFALEAFLLVSSSVVVGLVFSFPIFGLSERIFLLIGCIITFAIVLNFHIILDIFFKLIKKHEEEKIRIEKKDILGIWGLYLLMWASASIGFALFIYSITDSSDINNFFYFASSYPLSWVSGFISPMPGGIGIRESVLVWLLKKSSSGALAYFISIFSRGILIMCELIGYMFIYALTNYRKRCNK